MMLVPQFRFLIPFLGFVRVVLEQDNATYMNPILDQQAADPWVVRYEDHYLMTFTLNNNITIYRSRTLTNWNDASTKLVFSPPEGEPYSHSLWAPELHNIDSRWYVIFTANSDNESPPPETDMLCDYTCPAVNHRMYVLESSGSDPWESNYTLRGALNTFDQFAIDGTYFQHSTGLYHVYSCWFEKHISWPANLCITKLSNPYTVTSNLSQRTILSVPSLPWEKTPYGRTINDRLSSNEGPQQLTSPALAPDSTTSRPRRTFLIYSAARSDNRNYCLGQLELVGPDPMNVNDWRKTTEAPVFYQDRWEHAYGVGHASFTTSPDGRESWLVYHGMRNPSEGWKARTIRTQRFSWSDDGKPVFPRPGYGPYQVPSGQV